MVKSQWQLKAVANQINQKYVEEKAKVKEERKKIRELKKVNRELQLELKKAQIKLKRTDALERDYSYLKENYEKSENMRKQQMYVIDQLKEEIYLAKKKNSVNKKKRRK